ncbi:THAP domain-containing protein 2-like isoform X4 [Coccinella septempunctata]|uniref:THAP domain-containing protein 2-like isoform X4 n=1 Tax=Coccinella septempunctata TaxID=41139 RepID=UPI001D094C48|nr:THAP domain-containing protein 2-like isoform X4 [Coccinella septempunctata]
MDMGERCIVIKEADIAYDEFPLNPKRRALWIQAIKRENWQPSPHARICSIHFKEEDLDRTSLSCVRVREQAVPFIFSEFPSKNVLKAAPHEREASAVEPWPVDNSVVSEMIPSTSTGDTVEEVIPMEVEETNITIYRNLLAEKDKAIEEKDEIIARCKKKIASRDRCIVRIRQESYRARKRVVNLRNVLKELKGKLKIYEKSRKMLDRDKTQNGSVI